MCDLPDPLEIFEELGKVVKDFFKGVLNVFKSPFGPKINIPEQSEIDRGQIQGVLLNKDSAVASIPVVYGTRMVGGTRVFVSTNGSTNQYLYLAIVLAEGQCSGYTSLLIDDNTVPLSAYTHGTLATPSSGNYQNKLQVQFFDGRDDQVASSILTNAPGWTADHKLSGLCYMAFRFEWLPPNPTQEDVDNNPYSGGIPDIKVILQGKKIFNVLTAYNPADFGAYISKPSSWTAATNQNLKFQASGNPANYTIRFNTTAADSVVRVQHAMTTGGTAGATTLTTSVTLQDDATLATIAAFTLGPTTSVETFTHDIDERYTLPTGTYRAVFATTLDNSEVTGSTTSWVMSLDIEPPTTTRSTLYENETLVGAGSQGFNNPVNVLLDYLRNPRYGKGLDNIDFNWLSFRVAANLCEQTINYTDSTTGKAFTCDAVLDTSEALMNNVRRILQGFRGMMPFTQGKYLLKIEHGGDDNDITASPSDPGIVLTLTEDNILGGIQLQGETKETKLNRCRITYVDPSADYQPNEVIWPEDGSAEDTQYLSEDGIRLEKDVILDTITSREQAIQYAEVVVKRTRQAKIITLATSVSAANLSVGDLFRVINSNLGLDAVFRLMSIQIQPTGEISLSGFEHVASNYGFVAKDPDIQRPAISLPNPLTVSAPTSLSLSSGAVHNEEINTNAYVETNNTNRRILVSWLAPADPFVSRYIVQYKLSADSDYTTWTTTVATTTHIDFVVLGSSYDVRVAAINSLDRRSAFTTVTAHTVVA